ncbi:MAG: hypothetical protein QW416_00275 [Candidatus Nitrosocaldaceae archaeon]
MSFIALEGSNPSPGAIIYWAKCLAYTTIECSSYHYKKMNHECFIHEYVSYRIMDILLVLKIEKIYE